MSKSLKKKFILLALSFSCRVIRFSSNEGKKQFCIFQEGPHRSRRQSLVPQETTSKVDKGIASVAIIAKAAFLAGVVLAFTKALLLNSAFLEYAILTCFFGYSVFCIKLQPYEFFSQLRNFNVFHVVRKTEVVFLKKKGKVNVQL